MFTEQDFKTEETLLMEKMRREIDAIFNILEGENSGLDETWILEEDEEEDEEYVLED